TSRDGSNADVVIGDTPPTLSCGSTSVAGVSAGSLVSSEADTRAVIMVAFCTYPRRAIDDCSVTANAVEQGQLAGPASTASPRPPTNSTERDPVQRMRARARAATVGGCALARCVKRFGVSTR